MNEEPEAPVEEARPDEEIDESERAYREMQKLFEELSFRERWRRMMAGLKMPKDTGEYKFAKLQLQRLSRRPSRPRSRSSSRRRRSRSSRRRRSRRRRPTRSSRTSPRSTASRATSRPSTSPRR